MFKSVYVGAFAFALTTLFTSTALADDWTAVKLRGIVMGLFGGEWVKLERGAIIPGDQGIRTLASGRVTFERGEETIEVGPDTQIQIVDRAGYDKYTTVKQYFGRVEVEAEVRDVTHFAVQTPHLAAVVKGTRFVVISGEEGATVEVERGSVAVEDSDDHSSVVVTAGQEVTATPDAVMEVSGQGELPVVVDASGRPLNPRAAEVRNANANDHVNGRNLRAEDVRDRSHNGRDKGNAGNNGNGNDQGDSGNSQGNSGNGNSGGGNSGSSSSSNSGHAGDNGNGNGHGNSGSNGNGNSSSSSSSNSGHGNGGGNGKGNN